MALPSGRVYGLDDVSETFGYDYGQLLLSGEKKPDAEKIVRDIVTAQLAAR